MEVNELDDDMLVVIVGDGADVEDNKFPAPIKEELLDCDEVEKLIETAATHGEFVDIVIKQEREDYEDCDEEWYDDADEEFIPEEDIDEDDDDEDEDDEDYEVDDGSADEAQNKQRHKMLNPSQRKSFVKELRDQYAELEDDNNALVVTLSEIMRSVKPPPPPRDYFMMNGIMFECVYCGTISETQPAAGRHYQEKHGERYLICFACGVDFRSTTNLYKHEKRCTAPDAVVVLKARARVLGRKGRSRPYIPKHYPDDLKKPSERKYSCSQCSARFVTKTYLHSHEMLHRGVRPYMCSVCPSAYTSLAALSRHRKKHSDDQYICDHCGRIFKIKAALVTHMDTHLPIKRFGCEHCEKRYATKAAHRRHVQSQHLGLPPPCVCKICFKRYPLMSVLKEHTRRAHGLLLMTRRMFFQSLPTLTDTQIQQAKVVLKSELEPDHSSSLRPVSTFCPMAPPEVDKSVDIPSSDGQFSDGSPDYIFENVVKEEQIDEEDEIIEQRVVLSEEVLQYVQSIQEGLSEGDSCNVVVIEQDGVLNNSYPEGSNGLVNEIQLVLQDGEYVLHSET